MKKFQKTFAGVSVIAGAIGAMAMVAPAANAATGKSLVLISQAATRSVGYEQTSSNGDGLGTCLALPAHNTGDAVVAPHTTVYNGDNLKVVAYNSGNCTGSSTRTVGATVQGNDSVYRLDIR